MTTTIRLSRNANFSIFKLSNSSDAALNLGPCSHKNVCFFGWKLHSQPCFIHVNNFRKMEWSVRSNVDASGFDPSSSNGGRPRLIRAIQGIQTKLGVRIQELRKNLPMKILFFLPAAVTICCYGNISCIYHKKHNTSESRLESMHGPTPLVATHAL
ncbi:hypothetical protein E1A91_D02G121900v1 [Gossypium mustelinum]|uniref:Uncharacterized protein n=1 Tax=Gossypium mustelinum TaxID=34275 RepID=A0A5D2VUN5_GOSMU|nr:hypothetical protein E1A91_D02G121900v1 [Gossypium mustelinum]